MNDKLLLMMKITMISHLMMQPTRGSLCQNGTLIVNQIINRMINPFHMEKKKKFTG